MKDKNKKWRRQKDDTEEEFGRKIFFKSSNRDCDKLMQVAALHLE